MKERPIIMTTDSIRGILDGRKTMTRRVIKPQPELCGNFYELDKAGWSSGITSITPVYGHSLYYACPYGVPGDRLWVREAFKIEEENRVRYLADIDQPAYERGWRSSIFMPRWASRITLEVVNVRVERLQEISEEGAIAEGISPISPGYNGVMWSAKIADETLCSRDPIDLYSLVWDTLNAKRGYSWSSNPWVWVIEFKKAVSDG